MMIYNQTTKIFDKYEVKMEIKNNCQNNELHQFNKPSVEYVNGYKEY